MSQRYLGSGRFARAEEDLAKAKPPPTFWVLWNGFSFEPQRVEIMSRRNYYKNRGNRYNKWFKYFAHLPVPSKHVVILLPTFKSLLFRH